MDDERFDELIERAGRSYRVPPPTYGDCSARTATPKAALPGTLSRSLSGSVLACAGASTSDPAANAAAASMADKRRCRIGLGMEAASGRMGGLLGVAGGGAVRR